MSLNPALATLVAALLLSGASQAQTNLRPGSALDRLLGVEVNGEEEEEASSSAAATQPETTEEDTPKAAASPSALGQGTIWSPGRSMWGLGAANSGHWQDSLIGKQAFGDPYAAGPTGDEEAESQDSDGVPSVGVAPPLPGLGSGYASGYSSGYTSEYSSSYGAASPYWSATRQGAAGRTRRY